MAKETHSANEDIWDVSDTSEYVSGPELEREWSSRQTRFNALGYRDGIEAGKKSSVQEGFEAGFLEAVDAGFDCGLTRGWTSALMALPEAVKKSLLDDATQMQIGSLQTTISLISSDQAQRIFYQGIAEVTDGESLGTVSTMNEVNRIHIEVQSTLRSAGVMLP